MTLITGQLQSIESIGSALDPSGLCSSGSEHACIKIIILKRKKPISKGSVAKLFGEGPKPAARGVFNGDQSFNLEGSERDPHADPINSI